MFAGRTQVKTKIRWEVPSSGSHEPLCLHCFLCHSQLSLATLPGLTCILSTDEWMDRWMDGWTDSGRGLANHNCRFQCTTAFTVLMNSMTQNTEGRNEGTVEKEGGRRKAGSNDNSNLPGNDKDVAHAGMACRIC